MVGIKPVVYDKVSTYIITYGKIRAVEFPNRTNKIHISSLPTAFAALGASLAGLEVDSVGYNILYKQSINYQFCLLTIFNNLLYYAH
jgi:hypothetical protein